MGTLNLTSLISQIKLHHVNRGDLTDEIVIDKLNLVQERLARLWEWEELGRVLDTNLTITSVAEDDKFIAFPTNMREIVSFRLITTDGASRKLEEKSQRQFDQIVPEPEFYARGKPSIYTINNNTAELWNVPDTAYRVIIRIQQRPDAFSSGVGGAKSNLDRKDDILIYFTVSMIWDHLGEYERASRFFGIANNMIEKAKDEQETKPDREIKPLSETRISTIPGSYWANPFITQVR